MSLLSKSHTTAVGRFRIAALALMIAATALPDAAAQPVEQKQILLETSAGELVQLGARAASVFVADPAIADVQVPSPNNVFVFGKKPGQTTLFALGNDGKVLASYMVRVTHNIDDLRRLLRQEVPEATIELASTPSGLVLSGLSPNADIAERARSVAARYLGEKELLINRMKIAAPSQVNLRVRVAEVSRSVSKELGFNWEALFSPGNFLFGFATGRDAVSSAGTFLRSPTGAANVVAGFNSKNVNLNTVIDAMAQEGLVSILAEPNLTAVSGETANFLAGGEFPIPIAQGDDRVTIEFKQFGVSLDFVPTVLSSDRISLRVRPEVSELSDRGAIELDGIRIPGLAVRRAETTIELGSGQSFAIAGLIQNNSNTDVNRLPGLGDLPVLGALFRSSRFLRNETELVIIVTPFVVRPISNSQALRLPTDGLTPASDLERIFMGRVTRSQPQAGAAGPLGVNGLRLRGDAGFIID